MKRKSIEGKIPVSNTPNVRATKPFENNINGYTFFDPNEVEAVTKYNAPYQDWRNNINGSLAGTPLVKGPHYEFKMKNGGLRYIPEKEVGNYWKGDVSNLKQMSKGGELFNRNKRQYGGYLKIDDAMYKKLGLGDWLNDNAGNVLKVAGGGLMAATGIGAAAGAGMIASGLTGMVSDDITNKTNDSTQSVIDNKNEVSKLKNRLNAEYMEKGGFIDYKKGSKHSDPLGGIPVDQMGNPVMTSKQKPAAITEKGEVTYVFPDGKSLVLSEKLGDVKKFNKIKNSYKLRLGKDLKGHDTIAQGGLLKDMNSLAEEITARNTPKETEGGLPSYWSGGPIFDNPPDPMDVYKIPSPFTNNIKAPNTRPNIPVPYSPTAQSFNPNTLDGKTPLTDKKSTTKTTPGYSVLNNYDNSNFPVNKTPITEINPAVYDNTDYSQQINDYTDTNFTEANKSVVKSPSSDVPQGELYNPMLGASLTAGIGGAATVLGNLAMSKAYKKPTPTSPKLINAPTVSYEADRQSVRTQGTIARNSGLSAIRNTGMTKGGYSANASGITTGVQKNVNDSLSKSYQNEENINKQLKMSADSSNAQSINQAEQFNAYRQDQYDYNKLPFYQGALGSIQGVTNDLSKARDMKNYLGINAGRTGYEVRRNPVTKKLEMVPVKGFFERIEGN